MGEPRSVAEEFVTAALEGEEFSRLLSVFVLLLVPSDEGEVAAKRPVLCIIEPSFRDSIRVDWTPGRDVRCESNAETC